MMMEKTEIISAKKLDACFMNLEIGLDVDAWKSNKAKIYNDVRVDPKIEYVTAIVGSGNEFVEHENGAIVIASVNNHKGQYYSLNRFLLLESSDNEVLLQKMKEVSEEKDEIMLITFRIDDNIGPKQHNYRVEFVEYSVYEQELSIKNWNGTVLEYFETTQPNSIRDALSEDKYGNCRCLGEAFLINKSGADIMYAVDSIDEVCRKMDKHGRRFLLIDIYYGPEFNLYMTFIDMMHFCEFEIPVYFDKNKYAKTEDEYYAALGALNNELGWKVSKVDYMKEMKSKCSSKSCKYPKEIIDKYKELVIDEVLLLSDSHEEFFNDERKRCFWEGRKADSAFGVSEYYGNFEKISYFNTHVAASSLRIWCTYSGEEIMRWLELDEDDNVCINLENVVEYGKDSGKDLVWKNFVDGARKREWMSFLGVACSEEFVNFMVEYDEPVNCSLKNVKSYFVNPYDNILRIENEEKDYKFALVKRRERFVGFSSEEELEDLECAFRPNDNLCISFIKMNIECNLPKNIIYEKPPPCKRYSEEAIKSWKDTETKKEYYVGIEGSKREDKFPKNFIIVNEEGELWSFSDKEKSLPVISFCNRMEWGNQVYGIETNFKEGFSINLGPISLALLEGVNPIRMAIRMNTFEGIETKIDGYWKNKIFDIQTREHATMNVNTEKIRVKKGLSLVNSDVNLMRASFKRKESKEEPLEEFLEMQYEDENDAYKKAEKIDKIKRNLLVDNEFERLVIINDEFREKDIIKGKHKGREGVYNEFMRNSSFMELIAENLYKFEYESGEECEEENEVEGGGSEYTEKIHDYPMFKNEQNIEEYLGHENDDEYLLADAIAESRIKSGTDTYKKILLYFRENESLPSVEGTDNPTTDCGTELPSVEYFWKEYDVNYELKTETLNSLDE